MSYIIYGREICPETSRQHWQGYVEFKNSIRQSRVKRLLSGAHIERRAGSVEAAVSYCRKDGDFTEHGTISNQGKRSDLESISNAISTGESTLANIAISHPSKFVQYGRGFTFLSAISSSATQRVWRSVSVEIWWGVTGSGKTRKWFESYWPDCYRFQYSKNNDWWCGYERQKNICFDEFASQIMLSNMLMYCDGHPMRLEVKGAHAYANWDSVTIISNENPQTFYSNCPIEKRNAFARRITKVLQFTGEDIIESNSFAFANLPADFVTADANV